MKDRTDVLLRSSQHFCTSRHNQRQSQLQFSCVNLEQRKSDANICKCVSIWSNKTSKMSTLIPI